MAERVYGPDGSRGARLQPGDFGEMAWLVEQSDGDRPGLSVARMTVRPGKRGQGHCHDNCVEVITLVAGALRVHRGAEAVDLAAGDCIVIPRGCRHAVENVTSQDCLAIVAYSSGSRDYSPAS